MPKSIILVAMLCLGGSASVSLADSPVVLNEIMYHSATNEALLEWVELQNQLAVDVDLSKWTLDGGIHFSFPEGTIIRAGGYLVVASSPATLIAATGRTNVAGPFTDRLANSGEKIQLRNNNQRLMDEVSYGADGNWPVAPDGAGPSLARRKANLKGSDAVNWLASLQVGGTPGAENFPAQTAQVISNTLATIEGAWKFNDTGTDLGTAWRDPNYNDAPWPTGAALFFEEDAPLPAAKNTPLAPGHLTYYFRTRFVLTGEVSRVQLALRPIVDDGAVGYLNGVEVFRINMPAGELSYSSLASAVVGDANFGDTIFVPSENLVSGTNVLAVEVHQGPTFSSYPQSVLASGPVGYWRLGESSGTALDSASANGLPQAGAQNGVYSGFLPGNQIQAGPRGLDVLNGQPLSGFEANNPASRFAGNTDGGNDVITITDPGVFNFASTRTFTLEAWVNGSAAQEGGAAIIAKGTGGGGEQYAIDVAGGVYRFFCWDGGTPNNAVVATSSIGPDDTWQHVVAVLDQPAGRMKIYVNGVERGSATPRPTLVNTGHEVSIGARKNSGSSAYDLNFDGRIDEVAIYSRALTTNEILGHLYASLSNSVASGADTNDVVFGLEISSRETLLESERPLVVFNELASATNSAFWFELINYGHATVDLGGWTLARFSGLTNREYVFTSQPLPPGQLLQVTKAQLGFGVDPGDRLVLYQPGRSNVADAVVVKTSLRGRSPDGPGAWWFPNQPTPGASNSFQFHDELVINEIMFHHRELLPEAASVSATNVLVSITNLWRYHNLGVDLGTGWRAPAFNDSTWPASNALFFAPISPLVLPAAKNTFLPLTNSSGSRITTYYFRTQFQFNGETNGLRLALQSIVDDGAVFYLNGAEVYRMNMPATNIDYGTLSTVNVGIPVYTGPVVISAGNILQGLNTLAVEVHQFATNSTDFDFGTALLAWYELSPALPFRDSPESWVEIFNRGSNVVDLTGWRLDEAIDYHFPNGKSLSPAG
ncbi:MAG: exported protein of unknown function, partial [Verrucomicrobiales bacterium]|nr:exported protein of unknown function [Verrucomicrobiales bacterium]